VEERESHQGANGTTPGREAPPHHRIGPCRRWAPNRLALSGKVMGQVIGWSGSAAQLIR
jgi:hypothetical protein